MPDSDENLPSLETLQHRIDEAGARSETVHEERVSSASATSEAARLAWSIVSGATVGIFGGYFIDRWLDTSPIFLIAGFFLGFATGLYALISGAGKKD